MVTVAVYGYLVLKRGYLEKGLGVLRRVEYGR